MDRLIISQGLLCRQWYENDDKLQNKIIVPGSLYTDVVHYFHDIPSGGHLGADKTLAKLRQIFYWPGIKEFVQKYCVQCTKCATRKTSKPTRSPLGHSVVLAPLERVAVDINGPLPRSESGNAYVLVICDCFTRWTEAVALPNQAAETVAKAFVDTYVSRFGVPLSIHSDQGSNFTSSLFNDMCGLLQIKHTTSTALHPQSNGMVERFNRTL